MTKDTFAGLALLALAILYWLTADGIPKSPLSGHVGADGLPKLLAWALGIFSVILIGRGVLAARSRSTGTRGTAPLNADEWRDAWHPHLRALGMLAIAVAYLFALPTLGYVVSIGLLMAAVALYNGAPGVLRVGATAGAGAILLYLLFVRLLGIKLPGGIWSGLF